MSGPGIDDWTPIGGSAQAVPAPDGVDDWAPVSAPAPELGSSLKDWANIPDKDESKGRPFLSLLPHGLDTNTGKYDSTGPAPWLPEVLWETPSMLKGMAKSVVRGIEAFDPAHPGDANDPRTESDIFSAASLFASPLKFPGKGAPMPPSPEILRPSGLEVPPEGPSYGPKAPPGPDDWTPVGGGVEAGPNPRTATAAQRPFAKAANVTDLNEHGYPVGAPTSNLPVVRPIPKPEPTPEAPITPVDDWQAAPPSPPQGIERAPTPEIAAAREVVNTAPTEAQKEAGNYAKGHVTIQGIPVAIENPLGSERSGVSPEGEPWSVKMPADYGYIKRTEGADGEHVDTYIGPNPKSDRVFVVDQIDAKTGAFDEHKVMIGFDSPEQATDTYKNAFSDNLGQARIGGLSEMSVPEFKAKLQSDNWQKPITEQKPALAERQVPPTPYVTKGIDTYKDQVPFTAREQAFANEVNSVAKQIMPDAQVDIFNRMRQGDEKVTGFIYRNGLKKAVAISLESPSAIRTTQHEAIHFLKDYLTDEEWATLENAADKEGWHEKHDIDKRYGDLPDELKTEEAIASEFGEYRAGKPTGNGLVDKIFAKWKGLLDGIRTAFRRRFGTKATASDIFKDIHEGKVGRRKPQADRQIEPLNEAGGEGGVGEPPASEGEFDPPQEPGPELFRWIRGQEDALTRIRGENEADRTQALQYIEALPPELKDPVTNERIYHAIENPEGVPLTPEEQALSDKYLAPIRQEANEVFNRINGKIKGVQIGMDGYMHRIVKGKGTMYDPVGSAKPFSENPEIDWDKVKGDIKDLARKFGFGSGRGLGRKTASMNQRKMWMAEGNRGTKQIVRGLFKPGDEFTSTSGEKFKVRQATTKEIESGSEVRYFKNAIANSLDNLLRLKRVERNINYLESLKKDPTFLSLAQPMGSKNIPPLSWRGTDLPQLRGWVMEPRIAKMLDNFYEVMPKAEYGKMLQKVNHALTSAIFVNPISALFGHGLNVATHWYVGRGWDNFLPQRWARSSVNGMRAFNDVWKQTPRYQQMLREGNALMYAPTINREFHQTMIKLMGGEIKRDPKTWAQIAKQAGTTPKYLYDALSNVSSKGLWMANDIFMLQRVYDLMDKGKNVREAIAEAEHEIPNYRIPSEAWDGPAGRAFSDAMRNPNLFIFSRYRYGLIHAYSKTVADLVGRYSKLGDRGKAAGQLLALGVLFGILYPMGDQLVKGLTHNRKAFLRRSGPTTVLDSIKGWMKGAPKGDDAADVKNLYTGISGLFGFAPGTLAIGQALGNRDLFTGKHIYNPGGTPVEIAGELAYYGLSQPYPIQQAEEVAGGRKDRHEIEASWLGINDPTEKEVALRRRYIAKDYAADKKAWANRLKKLRKEGHSLYNSVFGGD